MIGLVHFSLVFFDLGLNRVFNLVFFIFFKETLNSGKGITVIRKRKRDCENGHALNLPKVPCYFNINKTLKIHTVLAPLKATLDK